MAERNRPPLHRLTMLRDDPAIRWLSLWSRLKVAAAGLALWFVWLGLIGVAIAEWGAVGRSRKALMTEVQLSHALGAILAAVLICLAPMVYWASLQIRNRAMLALVWKEIMARASPLDDWSKLDDAPDDRPLSLVGWVRGRSHLLHRIDGKPCVGLALGCRLRTIKTFVDWGHHDLWTGKPRRFDYVQRDSEVMETLFDFDLVGDDGRSIPIEVAGARLLGERNVAMLGDDQDERDLIVWLDLPSGCTPLPRKAYVLRDGDPVMVVGYKTSAMDTGTRGYRQAPFRTTVASTLSLPLLIYPLPPPAERREDLAAG
jgi:hypothetical protein